MILLSKIYRKLTLVALALSCGAAIYAQHSTSSPYSMFGVGTLTPQEDATSMGMGHAGIALAPKDWLNTTNPAGAADLDSLTFHINAQLKWFYGREESEQPHHQSVYSTNIDGIVFGFRAKKWWGSCIGYAPYSTVGYNITDPKEFVFGSSSEIYSVNHVGSGGLQRAFFNNAFTVLNHVTFGISAGALWGSITKKETADFSNIGGERIYNTKKYTMNNWFFEYGVQFNFNIGQLNNFRFGAVYNQKTNLRSSYDHIVSNDISSELFFDDVTPLKGEFAVPESYGFGMAYNRKRFTAALDYRKNLWGDVMNVKFRETNNFIDNWTLGGGIEWACGNFGDPFYKRLRYRIGCIYETSYLGMNTKKIKNMETVTEKNLVYDKETGTWSIQPCEVQIPVFQKSGANLDALAFTAGITIPVGQWRNAIVVGYEYRNHGTKSGGLIKEKFHNFKIALNIRETWFVKSKFE